MATQEDKRPTQPTWLEFSYDAFSRIVMRKHQIAVPPRDSALSQEELEVRVRLLSELAHLPPG